MIEYVMHGIKIKLFKGDKKTCPRRSTRKVSENLQNSYLGFSYPITP